MYHREIYNIFIGTFSYFYFRNNYLFYFFTTIFLHFNVKLNELRNLLGKNQVFVQYIKLLLQQEGVFARCPELCPSILLTGTADNRIFYIERRLMLNKIMKISFQIFWFVHLSFHQCFGQRSYVWVEQVKTQSLVCLQEYQNTPLYAAFAIFVDENNIPILQRSHRLRDNELNLAVHPTLTDICTITLCL